MLWVVVWWGGGDGPCDFGVSPSSKSFFFLAPTRFFWGGNFYLTWGSVGLELGHELGLRLDNHLFYLFALFKNKKKEYSAKSQNIMNENPTNSPRAPPNSDTNETQGYIITSVLRLTFLLASMIKRYVVFVEKLKQDVGIVSKCNEVSSFLQYLLWKNVYRWGRIFSVFARHTAFGLVNNFFNI